MYSLSVNSSVPSVETLLTVRARYGTANGRCRRRTHKSDALYSRARRANFQTVSQEQSYKVMVGLALRNRGALEIMKSDAMRAVVLPGWPNGEHHPMGPCYV